MRGLTRHPTSEWVRAIIFSFLLQGAQLNPKRKIVRVATGSGTCLGSTTEPLECLTTREAFSSHRSGRSGNTVAPTANTTHRIHGDAMIFNDGDFV
jgi:hypothetical protein